MPLNQKFLRGEIVDLEEVVRQIGEQLYSIIGFFIEQEDFTITFPIAFARYFGTSTAEFELT